MLKLLMLAAITAGAATTEEKKLHWIILDDMHVQVEGVLQPNGKVRWEPGSPFNRKSKEEAERVRAIGKKRGGIPDYGLNLAKVQEDAKKSHQSSDGSDDKRPKLHVTVIGPDADRQHVMRDLGERQEPAHPALAPLRGSIHIQEYGPGDWAVDPRLGYQVNGKPTIMVQLPGGKEVWRAENYNAGPESLAKVIEFERRKADSGYDPKKTPGPGSGLCPLGFTKQDWPVVLIAGVVVVYIYLSPKRAEQ